MAWPSKTRVLYEAEQRRAEQFRVVGEVSRHITSILPVDELLDEIVRLIKASFGYYLVTVGLIEDDEVVFKAGTKTDWPEEPVPASLAPSRKHRHHRLGRRHRQAAPGIRREPGTTLSLFARFQRNAL